MPKYRWVLYGLLPCLTASLPLNAVRAEEGRGPEAGWSFNLAAGTGYVFSNDQLQPNDGNERVRDLDDNANRFDRVIPLASFDLRGDYQKLTKAGGSLTRVYDHRHLDTTVKRIIVTQEWRFNGKAPIGVTLPYGCDRLQDLSIDEAAKSHRVYRDPIRVVGLHRHT